MSRRSIKRHKKAIEKIDGLYDEKGDVKIIHYAAESTYKTDEDRAPRIVAIAILDFKATTIITFSIDKMAELNHIPISRIKEKYAELEKKMLESYFTYVRENTNKKWACWKMKDITYGFLGLEFRYRVLGGEPVIIPEENKYQISDLFKAKYGSRYISKGTDLSKGRLYQLMEKNDITKKHLLSGKEEAEAFASEHFSSITKSTTSKVEALSFLISRSAESTLKTDSRLLHRVQEFYGFTPQGIYELSKTNWLVALIWLIIGVGVGKLFSLLL